MAISLVKTWSLLQKSMETLAVAQGTTTALLIRKISYRNNTNFYPDNRPKPAEQPGKIVRVWK